MITLKPQLARRLFPLLGHAKVTVCVLTFAVLSLLLSAFVSLFVAFGISGLVAYIMFQFLEHQSIRIECPSCMALIEGDTPWICGYGMKDDLCKNENTSEFPFLHQCERCGKKPKAYQCHHCGALVFLTDDRQKTQYARILQLSRAGEVAEKEFSRIRSEEEEIQDLKHQLVKTRWEKKIQDAMKDESIEKAKTLEREIENAVKTGLQFEQIRTKMHAKVDAEYFDDEEARLRARAIIDDVLRRYALAES